MRYLHTTIRVRDLARSLEFYENLVGLKVISRFAAGPQEFAFLANAQGETQLELIGAEGSPAYIRQGISIGFETDDLERTRAAAGSLGLVPGEILCPNPHARFFFVDDPDGVSVQFMQKHGA